MADDDWNVVIPKRLHGSSSSTANPAGGNRSKQQSQKGQGNNQQQYKKTNVNSHNAKNQPNDSNNGRPKPRNTPHVNAKKNGKPKPSMMTVGAMLPLGKKKKLKKDVNMKISQQQKPKQRQSHPNHNIPQNSYQHPQRQQQRNSGLHTESIQDFPALGRSNFPALPQASVPSVSKRGWGAVPKPQPAPPISFSTEVKPSSNRQIPSFSGPTLSRSAPPSKHGTPQQQPTRVLKRGEAIAGKGAAPAVSNKKKKEKPNANPKTKSIKQEVPSSSFFFQPKPRNAESETQLAAPRELQGEEHQLLRLMQERNVYQKKGRQRVAPRKKRFTALKKKVLQERLAQWRALHPEDDTSDKKAEDDSPPTSSTQESSRGIIRTRSLCLYNYTEPEELEDDDEYEEILDNLTSMATKIGPIEELFIPRSSLEGKMGTMADSPYRHPVFVLFQKESDASAALACWSDWLIGGSKLEVFGVEVQDDNIESPSPWSERVVAAVSKGQNQHESASVLEDLKSVDILLQKVLTEEDYEDEDCMGESLADLKKIAQRFGAVETIRPAGQNGDVLVTFDDVSLQGARWIAQDLCRVVVGGQPLYASVREPPVDGSGGLLVSATTRSSTLLLENVLTEEDLQDSDCLQESLNDIKELCLSYGAVSDIVAKGSAVKVTYQDNEENSTLAKTAAKGLNGIVLGGITVKASVLTTVDGEEDILNHSIDLYNIITKDDMEDEDCMEESLADVEKLASKYGKVMSINVCKAEGDFKNDPTKAYVRIQFAGDEPSVIPKALEGFSGMVIGGQIISASLPSSVAMSQQTFETTNAGDKRKPSETTQSNSVSKTTDNSKKARTDEKEPLYSGDKLISERFAAMKRVPKIPNKAGPRDYAANASTDERIKPLLQEMLGELMRLQKRAVEDKNAKARRRMVMGLREVARGIRAHKGTYQFAIQNCLDVLFLH